MFMRFLLLHGIVCRLTFAYFVPSRRRRSRHRRWLRWLPLFCSLRLSLSVGGIRCRPQTLCCIWSYITFSYTCTLRICTYTAYGSRATSGDVDLIRMLAAPPRPSAIRFEIFNFNAHIVVPVCAESFATASGRQLFLRVHVARARIHGIGGAARILPVVRRTQWRFHKYFQYISAETIVNLSCSK